MKPQPFSILIASAIFCGFLFNSCGFLISEAIAPNSCQKCQIISSSGEVLIEEDGCGGALYNMKERLKAKAFDVDGGCCSCRLECETYKKQEADIKPLE